MENLWVVLALTLVCIAVRQLWAAHRKRNPLPPAPPAPPRNPRVNLIEGGVVMAALLVTGFELVAVLPAVIVCIVGIVGVEIWGTSREQHQASPAARSDKPRKRNRSEMSTATQPAPHKTKDLGLEIIDTLIIALVLVFGIVRPFLLQTFYIPSSSMEPTLLGPYNPARKSEYTGTVVFGKQRGGDKLIANKFIYRFREPRRGEIVVFRPPDEAIIGNNFNYQQYEWVKHNPGKLQELVPGAAPDEVVLASLPKVPQQRDDYIKRVIGIAGDRIRIVAGEGIYLNGKPLEEPYVPINVMATIGTFPITRLVPPPEVKDVNDPNAMRGWYHYHRLYKEKIMRRVNENGEFVVPKDSVFVMGDNRSPSGSFDSRYWGVVPIKDVKARAVSTFWPFTRLKLL